ISPGFIRVARIPERDAVPNNPGSAQQTRALDGVLAEPVADRVDRSLQPLATRAHAFREQVELSARAIAERRASDAERSHRQPRIPRREQLQRRLVDLVAGRNRLGLFCLLREMSGVGPMPPRESRRAVASAMPERSVSCKRSKTATRFLWSIRCRPSRLSRLEACLAIQMEVETPADAVTHSPISSRMALLIARPTPSGPSFLSPGVPARFVDASSIDIRSTSGLCLSMISISLSDTSR